MSDQRVVVAVADRSSNTHPRRDDGGSDGVLSDAEGAPLGALDDGAFAEAYFEAKAGGLDGEDAFDVAFSAATGL